MTQLIQLFGVFLIFCIVSVNACELEKQVTIAFRSFKYAEALLELTDPTLRHSHSDIPVLLLGSFKEISEAASISILDSIREAKAAKDGRSIDVGLILSRQWIKRQGSHPDWAQIIHNIRKEFKRVAGFSLRAMLIEGKTAPVELVHAIEAANLAVLRRSEMQKLKFTSVRHKKNRRKLIKKLKKYIKKSSFLEIKFKTHPQAKHLKVIKKAFKKARRELVDISTCLLASPLRPEIPVKSVPRFACNY